MMTALILFLALQAGAQQDRPAIKGHSIGETLADFFQKEPAAAKKADQCRSRGREKIVMGVWSTCAEMQGGKISTDSGTFYFLDGDLARLEVHAGGGYPILLAEMTKRFGKAAHETVLPWQNAFGAKWEDRMSEWDGPEFYAELSEDNNPAGPGGGLVCTVKVESRAFHEKAVKAAGNRPSPLD